MTPPRGSVGRVLAVDPGLKRVGLAISDPLRIVASPLQTIPYRSRADLVQRLVALVGEREVSTVVIGLPLGTDGQEGEACRRSRNLARELAERGIHVELWDERFSSREAARALHDMGAARKRVRERLDPVAAALILKEYLEAGGQGP